VLVAREDTNVGFKWTVSFTSNVGDLRMMAALPIQYEMQRLRTEGGAPTPLNGQINLFYGEDSVSVSFDATAFELQAALESMNSVGKAEVSRDSSTNC
jgi:hypothetical protein